MCIILSMCIIVRNQLTGQCHLAVSNNTHPKTKACSDKMKTKVDSSNVLEPTVVLFISDENRFVSVQFSNTMILILNHRWCHSIHTQSLNIA